MQSSSQRLSSQIDNAERRLALPSSRLFLSFLIILSVLPDSARQTILPDLVACRLDRILLVVFSLELIARLAFLCNHWLQRRAARWEIILFFLDMVAVISFLPLEGLMDARSLRLVRLTRLLLLVAYWGDLGRDFFSMLGRRELRNQVVLVAFLGLVLSLVGAVVASHVAPSFDFDGDGNTGDDDDQNFFYVLWWSFRQVQDPGNLVNGIDQPAVVALSLVLTFTGLLVLALVIGIGTSAVEELLRRTRQKPIPLSGHSVILGTTDHSRILLEGLAKIYLKNLQPLRAALLGSTHLPDLLEQPTMRKVHFRHGNPVEVEDLDRVAIARAKRVMILGSDPEDPDGEAISAILATRRRNPQVDLYSEIDHERNFGAARTAGGPRTHIVGSGSFLGHYLVHQVIYPGSDELYSQLLHSFGCEIYTYIFTAEERNRLTAEARGKALDATDLYARSFFDHGINLIGLLVPPDNSEGESNGWEDDQLQSILNPVLVARTAKPGPIFDGKGGIRWHKVWGLIGIGLRWRQVKDSAVELYRDPHKTPSRSFSPDPGTLPKLSLPRKTIEKVVICGSSERVPRIVAEMCRFYPKLHVTILVSSPERINILGRDIRAALAAHLDKTTELRKTDQGVEVSAVDQNLPTAAQIRLQRAHWTDVYRMLQEGDLNLEDLDTLLLLPVAGSRDGVVALDCLHLADQANRGLLRFRPNLHVVGLVGDPIKGELLEKRLQHLASSLRFSIVSNEKIRHEYIVQNVFVRGLNSLFLELLSAQGQHLGRLDLPGSGTPLHEVDTTSLAGTLLHRGLILVGLVVEGSSGRQVELQVAEFERLSEAGWTTLRSLYVLGSREALSIIDAE